MSLPTVRLGDVCHFVRGPFGGALKKDIFVESGYAVYEQQHAIYNQLGNVRYFINQNKFQELKRFELAGGDLIMSCSGTMGKVAIVPKNIKQGIINQALLKLTPSNILDVNYLKSYMQSDLFQNNLRNETHGAAIKNVASVPVLKELKIPLPPLAQQQRIAAILDKANEIKVKREKAIAKLDELAQSIFIEMFSYDASPVKALVELGKVKTGGTPPSSMDDMFGDEIPFVTPGDLGSDARVKRYLTIKGARESVTIEAGAAMVCCIGAIIGKMDIAKEKSAFNQQINAVEWNDEIDDTYGFYALKCIKGDIISNASSTTLPIRLKAISTTTYVLLVGMHV